MDGREFDPGKDVAFFMQRAKQFEGFARSIQKGDYSFDALAALNEIRNRLEKFTPLLVIRRITDLCAACLPPLDVSVVKGKKVEVKVRTDELFAHWQLAYFQGTIDEEALCVDAKRVSSEELVPLCESFLKAREKKEEAELHAAEFEDWNPERQKALKASIRTLDEFQEARGELLDLIGAKGQRFDPEPEVPYVRQWRNICREHFASLGINYGREGLKPDAEEVRKRRRQLGWKQDDLVVAIRKASGILINVRTIRRLEAGNRVDAKTLLAVATALDVDIQSLIA